MGVRRPSLLVHSPFSARIVAPRQASDGAFSPDNISNMEGWFEGTSETYTDTAGTTATSSDDDDVKHWGDLHTSANNLTEGTGNPVWDSTPDDMDDDSVKFDGASNQFLTLDSSIDFTGDFHWAWAMNVQDTSNGGLFGKALNSGSFFYQWLVNGIQIRGETGGSVNLFHTSLSTGNQVLALDRSGSTITYYRNNVSIGTATFTTTFRMDEVMRILQSSSFSNTGNIGALMLYKTSPSTADRASLYQYLSDGWTGT